MFFFQGADGDEKRDDETDEERDERIWAQLTRKTPCATDPAGWATFYGKYHEKVSVVYNKLLEQAPPS